MMRHGGDFAFALVLAVGFGSLGLRCGVPSSPPVDALPACLATVGQSRRRASAPSPCALTPVRPSFPEAP